MPHVSTNVEEIATEMASIVDVSSQSSIPMALEKTRNEDLSENFIHTDSTKEVSIKQEISIEAEPLFNTCREHLRDIRNWHGEPKRNESQIGLHLVRRLSASLVKILHTKIVLPKKISTRKIAKVKTIAS